MWFLFARKRIPLRKFNGDFDPVKVREMAKNEQFTKFGSNIISQFGSSTQVINN